MNEADRNICFFYLYYYEQKIYTLIIFPLHLMYFLLFILNTNDILDAFS